MYSFSYSFNPYQSENIYMDGSSILAYLESTASKYGIDKYIKYLSKVKEASWNSNVCRWTLQISTGLDNVALEEYSCQYLLLCTGYYDYNQGHSPHFDGIESFRGTIIHPQAWPGNSRDNSLYKDKKVVVIGSGATAITLVPELAKNASHVSMVQRSPTYVSTF